MEAEDVEWATKLHKELGLYDLAVSEQIDLARPIQQPTASARGGRDIADDCSTYATIPIRPDDWHGEWSYEFGPA